ncbi:MAG TPA: HlyD family efflux transporter periplasmic adaptor subunit, partial [Bacteroidales bacterium]|nr:HlyD family efflux transporter periplasmic adaptor subunit [Bacteroidales bacterium]
INLAAATGGIVKEVIRKEGDHVKVNDPVVKLDDETDQLNIKQFKSEVLSQEGQVEMARLTLKDARVRLERKSELLRSTRDLLGKGAETANNLDDLETEVRSLILDTLKAAASLGIEQNTLEGDRENLRIATVNAGKKVLRSPYDGILLSIDAKPGSSVSQLGSYAELAPSGPEIVRAEVDELFANRIKIGQDAEIRYIGSDSLLAAGKLVFVSPYLTPKSLFSGKTGEQEDRRVRQVKVSLSSPSNIILNSRVECVIKVK